MTQVDAAAESGVQFSSLKSQWIWKESGQESLLSPGRCQLGWGERVGACSKASSIPPPVISGQEVSYAKGEALMQKQQCQLWKSRWNRSSGGLDSFKQLVFSSRVSLFPVSLRPVLRIVAADGRAAIGHHAVNVRTRWGIHCPSTVRRMRLRMYL